MTIRTVKHKPTTNVRDTVARVLQLIQRSNSWCQGTDLEQKRDSNGKTRSSFCLQGAIRAAISGRSEGAHFEYINDRVLYGKVSAALLKTASKNVERYVKTPPTDGSPYVPFGGDSIVDYNDCYATHKQLLNLLRDTLTRLG